MANKAPKKQPAQRGAAVAQLTARPPGDRLLTRAEVCDRLRISVITCYRRQRDDKDFPPGVALARSAYGTHRWGFWLRDVEAYEARLNVQQQPTKQRVGAVARHAEEVA